MDAQLLTGYNKNNSSIGNIPYIELQWDRRWKEPGAWSVYMRASDYPGSTLQYVKLAGHTEIGVVQKIEYAQTMHGEFITLSGFFLEKLLNWASSVLTYTIGSRSNLLSYIGRTCGSFSRVPDTTYSTAYPESDVGSDCFYKVTLSNTNTIPSSISGVIEPKTGVGDAIQDMIGEGYSFTAGLLLPSTAQSYTEVGLTVAFKAGRDKTSLVFSKANGNVSEMKYSQDWSGQVSKVRAALKIDPAIDLSSMWWDEYYAADGTAKGYTGDDGYSIGVMHDIKSVINPDDYPMGSTHIVPTIITDVSESSYELTQANLLEITREVAERARLDALNHKKEYGATMKILQVSGCEYPTNYDLGDEIKLSVPWIGNESFKTRIYEVREVHKAGQCNVEITTGKLYSRTHRGY